jgi:DNA repair exonuclease SbcCD ATPase subunit
VKIVRLQSSNILRLTAVDISPDGNLITIGGKNGAGKSSVLNSIAMVLGGAAMVPAEPIRNGETDARITVDLGDFIVTRKFSRDRLHDNLCHALAGSDCTCNPIYGETRSTLTVASKDGAKYASPQAMLDKILGRLTFDPLAFAHDDAKRQLETLRKLVGVDTTEIDQLRKKANDNRASLRRFLDGKLHDVSKMPSYDGIPEEEQSLDAVEQKVAEAKKAAEDRRRIEQKSQDMQMLLQRTDVAVADARIALQNIRKRIEDLQKEYADHEGRLSNLIDDQLELRKQLELAEKDASIAAANVVPIEELTREVSRIHSVNEQVRANKRWQQELLTIANMESEIDGYTNDIAAADEAKQVMLEAARFPVEGLGLSDAGITFNGVPFEQASASEQLRVSVAIGLALNPTLKVLLIRNGNLLDEDNLKIVAAQAAEADAQIWMEYVTSDAKAVQVMIADGSVAEA